VIYLAQRKRHPRTGLVRWIARRSYGEIQLATGAPVGDVVTVDAVYALHAETILEKMDMETTGKGGAV